MIKALILAVTVVALVGCTTPRAQRAYDACIEQGGGQKTCEHYAAEVNAMAWQGLGAGLQNSGAAMRAYQPQPPVVCTTTSYTGNLVTTCH